MTGDRAGGGGPAIRAPWRLLTSTTAATLPGAVGVYELRRDGRVVLVGYAGGRSRLGLRGVLADLVAERPGEEFRAEVTTAYLSRWRELLGRHLARTGALPEGNGGVRGIGPVGPRVRR